MENTLATASTTSFGGTSVGAGAVIRSFTASTATAKLIVPASAACARPSSWWCASTRAMAPMRSRTLLANRSDKKSKTSFLRCSFRSDAYLPRSERFSSKSGRAIEISITDRNLLFSGAAAKVGVYRLAHRLSPNRRSRLYHRLGALRRRRLDSHRRPFQSAGDGNERWELNGGKKIMMGAPA